MVEYSHLRKADRDKIEKLFLEKKKVKEIAEIIHVHPSTIYRELKRGAWFHTNSNWEDELSYSSDLAESRYRTNLAAKGVMMKIGNDFEYAKYIEKMIADYHYSPAATLGKIKADGLQFKTSICVTTLYNYIDKDVFARITNKDLPERMKRKKRYHHVHLRQSKRVQWETIENRPEDIKKRDEFGHWEMDTVKGKRRSKNSLLVLTERKTRKEIIVKLKRHCAEEVVKSLDILENQFQSNFPKIFKTITCDNGVEFSFAKQLEQSMLKKETKRTKVFFCHPYTSWERGSNEVANKLIRRWIPKGTDFDDITEERVKEIEDWINHYPRKIHKYRTSEELYLEELRLLE